jgi:uroporphyrinogen-III synthase
MPKPSKSRRLVKKERPLIGLRVLVGRARHQASALSSRLRELGAEVIEIPFIEIRQPLSYKPLDSALKNLHDYDWLILTSVNGAEALWERLKKLHLTKRHLQHLKVAAIGPATKKAIEKRGIKVNVVPEEYIAESVVDSLRNQVAGKRILLARAKVARDVIPRELRKLGAKVDVVEAYETVVPQTSRKRLRAVLEDPKRRPHVITFTSSSTVRNFVALVGNMLRSDDTHFASIGPVTSSTLLQCGLPVSIEARQYTIPGLVKAIVQHTRGKNKSSGDGDCCSVWKTNKVKGRGQECPRHTTKSTCNLLAVREPSGNLTHAGRRRSGSPRGQNRGLRFRTP